jgi:thiol-disulfide isomerase/thioredoxin
MKKKLLVLIAAAGTLLVAASMTIASPQLDVKSKDAEKAPEFTSVDANGKKIDLTSMLSKSDAVVLNFWASWCTACADEIPELLEFQKSHPKYGFYGVNVGESLSKAKKFVRRFSYPYEILMDEDEKISKLYKIDGLPQTVVIGKDGQIVFRGSRPPTDLK